MGADGWSADPIAAVTIERETEHFVWVRISAPVLHKTCVLKNKKVGLHGHRYFDTWEDARAELVRRETTATLHLESKLVRARERLQQVKALQPPPPEKT